MCVVFNIKCSWNYSTIIDITVHSTCKMGKEKLKWSQIINSEKRICRITSGKERKI